MPSVSPSPAPFPASHSLSTEQLSFNSHFSARHRPSTSSLDSHPDDHKPLTHLPGEPTVSLHKAEVHSFLIRELDTPLLDELYTKLWFVARRSGQSVDPLSQQRVKGRRIVPTEDPKLHLIWVHDQIYLKPIPLCLLNHNFWTAYLPRPMDDTLSRNSNTQKNRNNFQPELDRSVALGFLRSYAFLVQHRLDFIFARESHLIPENVEWDQWSRFIASFRNIEDHEVATRYHYGQLRLSRLNWAVRIFRPQCASTVWFYEVPHWSIELYLERAIAPLLFAFASLSVALSSMQVVLSVPGDGLDFAGLDASELGTIRRAFWVFSIIMLFSLGLIWVLLIIVPLGAIAWQLSWGYRNSRRAAV